MAEAYKKTKHGRDAKNNTLPNIDMKKKKTIQKKMVKRCMQELKIKNRHLIKRDRGG